MSEEERTDGDLGDGASPHYRRRALIERMIAALDKGASAMRRLAKSTEALVAVLQPPKRKP